MSEVVDRIKKLAVVVGMPTVLRQNAKVFYDRVQRYERQESHTVLEERLPGEKDWTPRPITLADIEACTPLYTDVDRMSQVRFDQFLYHRKRTRLGKTAFCLSEKDWING
jgi:hypothetical protein